MAHRSQCSSAGDNPLNPNYLPPHYREEYRLAIDALVEDSVEGYYQCLQKVDVVDFLCAPEIEYIHNVVQLPHEGNYGDQQRCPSGFGGDSSSDTYWPVHSDLDAPDLDLGWPQLNRYVGPTEVTTLVNPAEHDMPSIKEQARRLIRNAQQVVAIVMDMFTDVDIFAEILDAAMRNVAVYILLDELNAHHFVNMLSNCRINLEGIRSMRVRTVSGIPYQCRSGKLLKGQMMNRFMLTDCRAVLTGNYSFMWSFEKLHRCLAHLFLGQLVSNFDEEFRILYAQSQPLTIDNLPGPIEGFGPFAERKYLTDRSASIRESRKYATADNPCPEERPRHNFDERMDADWKTMPQNPTQQPRIGQMYDQGPSRIPLNVMESPKFNRRSYAEGRQTSHQPIQQPGMPPFEGQGRRIEALYSSYDKFRSPAYPPADQHPDPGLPHEMEPPENFDLVLNYLSSTSNAEMDQRDGPPLNPPEQMQTLQVSNTDRKDPAVRQGLRNWRINSYLSTFDNAADEEMSLPGTQASDPFDESPNPPDNTVSGPDLPAAKFPNTRGYLERPFHGYRKSNVPEPSEKYPEDFLTLPAQAKLTPSTSESSLTEADKTEEMEPQDVGPEESFRRRYNPKVQRGSRLRSSLIFSSQVEQPVSQDISTTGTHDEDTDKAEATEFKLPFALHVLGHRKKPKEPFEWSRFARSATVDIPPSAPDDVENKEDAEDSTLTKPLKGNHKNTDRATASKPTDVTLRPSSSQCELSKITQPMPLSESLLGEPFVDMSDADNRLLFFKQLAAKRKAEEASASAKGNADVLKTQTDLKNTVVKIEQPAKEQRPNDPVVVANTGKEKSDVSTDSEKLELKKFQTQDPSLSNKPEPSLKESSTPDPLGSSSSSEQIQSDVHTSKNITTYLGRPRVAREPFKLNRNVRSSILDSTFKKKPQEETVEKKEPKENSDGKATSKAAEVELGIPLIGLRPSSSQCELSETGLHVLQPQSLLDNSAIDMRDADNRLMFFKELAAKRKAEMAAAAKDPATVSLKTHEEPAAQKPNAEGISNSNKGETTLCKTALEKNVTMDVAQLPPMVSSRVDQDNEQRKTREHKSESQNDPVPVACCENEKSRSTTDSEKLELKLSQEQASTATPVPSQSTMSIQQVNVPNLQDASVKGGSQLPINVSPPTNSTKPSADQLGSLKHDSSLKESSSIAGTAEQPACPPSVPPTTGASSSASQNPTTDPTYLSQPVPSMTPPTTAEVKSTDEKTMDTRNPVESLSPPSLESSQSSSKTPEGVAQSTPANTVLSSDVETMKPESTSVLTENPATVKLGDAAAKSFSNACEIYLEPHSIKMPSEILSKEPGTLSKMEPPPSEANSVAPELSSATAVLPSQEDVEDKTNESLNIQPSPQCSADPTGSPESSVCLIEKESVDSPKPNAADIPPERTTMEEPVLPSSTLAPVSDGSEEVSKPGKRAEPTSSELSSPPTLNSPDLEQSPIPLVTASLSDQQTKPTLEVDLNQTPEQNKPMVASETTIESKSVTPESRPSEPIVTSEQSTVSIPCEVEEESTTTLEEAVPLSPLKAPQSRYLSSTANVISSSNLRDDTKLLLGQISANSQSRNEATKEQPVTDDDKESEADKNAIVQKVGGGKYSIRGSKKTTEEREVLLQKIQCMRKEGKAYSRFEMPP